MTPVLPAARRDRTHHWRLLLVIPAILVVGSGFAAPGAPPDKKLYLDPINIEPPPIADDDTVKYDYDIVYVRAPRPSGKRHRAGPRSATRAPWSPAPTSCSCTPTARRKCSSPSSRHESIADPFVSFDGQWVYFAKMHDALNHKGSDIYKVHVPTRKIIQLTEQTFTPNTGAADWSKTPLPAWGVYNLGPYPRARRQARLRQRSQRLQGDQPRLRPERPRPAALRHGRRRQQRRVHRPPEPRHGPAPGHPARMAGIMFSSLESQGLRSHHLWGLWSIHPDGTQLGPALSAPSRSATAPPTPPTSRRSSPTGASSSSRTTTSTTSASASYLQAARSSPRRATRRSARPTQDDPRNAPLRHGRHADGRPDLHSASRSARTASRR